MTAAARALHLQSLETRVPAKATILIGPEGGWDPQEVQTLRVAAGVTPVTFGQRTLRADTAGAAAIAVLGCVWKTMESSSGLDLGLRDLGRRTSETPRTAIRPRQSDVSSAEMLRERRYHRGFRLHEAADDEMPAGFDQLASVPAMRSRRLPVRLANTIRPGVTRSRTSAVPAGARDGPRDSARHFRRPIRAHPDRYRRPRDARAQAAAAIASTPDLHPISSTAPAADLEVLQRLQHQPGGGVMAWSQTPSRVG